MCRNSSVFFIFVVTLCSLVASVSSTAAEDWVSCKVSEGVHREPQMPKPSKAKTGADKRKGESTKAELVGYGPPLMALFDDVRCLNFTSAGTDDAAPAVEQLCPRYNLTVVGGGSKAGNYAMEKYRTEPVGGKGRGTRVTHLEVRVWQYQPKKGTCCS